MGLSEFVLGKRLGVTARDCECAFPLIVLREEDYPRFAQSGDITPDQFEYAQGIIELTIQGERIAKTRKQWADGLMSGALLGCPFSYTDSDKTKAMKLHAALVELEALAKAHPSAALDELIENVNRRFWRL